MLSFLLCSYLSVNNSKVLRHMMLVFKISYLRIYSTSLKNSLELKYSEKETPERLTNNRIDID